MATSNVMSKATCAYCSELLVDPRMLPCLHSFCLPCLVKVCEIKGTSETLECPTCNEKAVLQSDGVNGFPKDLRKAHEAEVAEYMVKLGSNKEECDRCVRKDTGHAIAFCKNCREFLCKTCREEHHSWRKTLNHEIITTGEEKGNKNESDLFSQSTEQLSQCPRPDHEVLKYYCGKCEVLICRDCIELDHNDHRGQCNLVKNVAAQAMEGLKEGLGRSQEAIAYLDTAINQCKKVSEQVGQRKVEIDKQISNSLTKVKNALLAKNEEICLQKITGLKMQENELQGLRDGLKLASGMIIAAQSHTASQQLSTKKLLSDRAALLLEKASIAPLNPQESGTFVTKITDPDIISQMVSLGDINGGPHAASSSCDVGFIPRAVVGKERIIKVTTRNEKGELYPNGGEMVEAKLSVLGSKDLPITGKSIDHEDGTYSLSFIAQSAGENELHVTIAGRHLKGSPYIIKVREPRSTPYTSLSCQKTISTKTTPFDVKLTEDGSLVVAELGYHTASFYSIDGTYQFSFGIGNGSNGSGDNQFNCPGGIAIKGDVIYITDNNNHRVQKFSISQRSFISKFGTYGSGDGQFSSPRGICIAPEGNVFVAEHSNNRVQIFQADGSFAYSITADPNNKESEFVNPWGLAFDLQGFLHITSYSSHCVKIYTPDGKYVDTYGSGTIKSPAGIAIDEEGYIAITGYGSAYYVWVYNPAHTELVNTISGFTNPAGVTFDAEGMILIADSSNHRIQKY